MRSRRVRGMVNRQRKMSEKAMLEIKMFRGVFINLFLNGKQLKRMFVEQFLLHLIQATMMEMF